MQNNTSRNEKRYECMKKTLKMFKKHGLMVYINRPDATYSSAYGIITDGMEICYIQFDYFGGYTMSYQYVPSRENGSGIGYPYDGSSLTYVTIDSFYNCVNEAYKNTHGFRNIQKYRNIQHYMKDEFHAKTFIQL